MQTLITHTAPAGLVVMPSVSHTLFSSIARVFPGGQAAHLADKIEEESEEKLRKNEGEYRRMRKMKEMFLSSPPPQG